MPKDAIRFQTIMGKAMIAVGSVAGRIPISMSTPRVMPPASPGRTRIISIRTYKNNSRPWLPALPNSRWDRIFAAVNSAPKLAYSSMHMTVVNGLAPAAIPTPRKMTPPSTSGLIRLVRLAQSSFANGPAGTR